MAHNGSHTVLCLMFQFTRRNTTITLSCVEWDPPPPTNNSTSLSSSTFYERMFVRLFPNGCRPRYACAQIRRPSPNVLLVRVSRFRTWPFVAEADSPVKCSQYFSFKDNPGLDGVGYQLFVPVAPLPICDMALVTSEIADGFGMKDFRVDFSSKIHCKGRFHMNRDDNGYVRTPRDPMTLVEIAGNDGRYFNGKSEGIDRARSMTFTLVLIDYPEPGEESEQSYRCIDSTGFKLDDGRQSIKSSSVTVSGADDIDVYMLTETGDDDTVLCWWFPVNSDTTMTTGEVVKRFYLLPGIACYDDTTSVRNVSVLATFTRVLGGALPVIPVPSVYTIVPELPISTKHHVTTDMGNIHSVDPLFVSMTAIVNLLLFVCCGGCCCYHFIA